MAQMMWPKCASPQTVMDEELLERKMVTIIQELVQSTKNIQEADYEDRAVSYES